MLQSYTKMCNPVLPPYAMIFKYPQIDEFYFFAAPTVLKDKAPYRQVQYMTEPVGNLTSNWPQQYNNLEVSDKYTVITQLGWLQKNIKISFYLTTIYLWCTNILSHIFFIVKTFTTVARCSSSPRKIYKTIMSYCQLIKKYILSLGCQTVFGLLSTNNKIRLMRYSQIIFSVTSMWSYWQGKN